MTYEREAGRSDVASNIYDVQSIRGLNFVTRHGSVDGENLAWMDQSIFLKFLSQIAFSKNSLIIDLGAHIGGFALNASAEKSCPVIGLEPDALSIKLARANAALNGLEQQAGFQQLAVGADDGIGLLHESTENWGHTLFDQGGPFNILTGNTNKVNVVSLRSALNLAGDREVFLKFNVEGAEHDIFASAATDVLRRCFAMVGEVHYDLGGGDFRAALDRIQSSGFKCHMHRDGPHRAYLTARRE